MTGVCLITSAAYIGPDLAAQFGRIPPAFLPIRNRRLFVHQHEVLKVAGARKILSLPDDFEPDQADLLLLNTREFEVVRVPVGLTLGASIVYVINMTASAGGRLSIMHGDTLLEGIDFSVVDGVSTAEMPCIYEWDVVCQDAQPISKVFSLEKTLVEKPIEYKAQKNEALSGWFSFSNAAALIQAITREGGNFVRALDRYAVDRPLQAISCNRWFDFGHAITFDQSRRRFTTERSFNHLDATHRTVIKSGTNNNKIEAEARWFEQLPLDMRIYTPAFLGKTEVSESKNYSIEYLHLPTLADLFVFGRQPRQLWSQIFQSCDEFLLACCKHASHKDKDTQSRALYAEKTMDRLELFARAKRIDLKAPCRFNGIWLPSLEQMVNIVDSAIPRSPVSHLTLVHGDFCFSNILYDIRANLVRVIDPRGMDASGEFTITGDLRYDLGKLYQSVIGGYDHIVAGYYDLKWLSALDVSLELPENTRLRDIKAEFLGRHFANLSLDTSAAPAICVLLFLSMLPLHSEDPSRQNAFLANAMRLFLQLETRTLKGNVAA